MARRVIVPDGARAMVPDGFEVADYEPLLLKGANEPQAIYQLELTVTAES